MHLLDVNVLIALADRQHPHFQAALSWFQANAAAEWATCPLTENGFLRILGHSSYSSGPGSPAAAATILEGMKQAVPQHHFIPDDVSLLDFGLSSLPKVTSGQLTDIYLLALAVKHRAKFLSLDRRIDPSLVPGGPAAYVQLTP